MLSQLTFLGGVLYEHWAQLFHYLASIQALIFFFFFFNKWCLGRKEREQSGYPIGFLLAHEETLWDELERQYVSQYCNDNSKNY